MSSDKTLPEEMKKLRRLTNLVFAVLGVLFVIATIQTKFNPFLIFIKSQNFIDFVANDLFPPNFSKATGLWDALLQTVGMSLIASFFGGIVAFCFCFLASYQTSPHSAVVKIMRGLASFQRNVPNVVWLFILVMAFGIGTAVGMLALFMNTVGFLLRAFAEVVDEVGKESMEALDSVGAGYLPKLCQCVIPEATPGFLSWLLYSIEYNIRSSGIVGACGGGGIGLVMMGYLKSFRYHIGFGIILTLAATVIAVNFLTNYLRMRALS